MKEVKLTRGFVALVDDDDFGRVSAIKWRYCPVRGKHEYAMGTTSGSHKTRKHMFMHRLLLNAPKGMDVDHIDGNGLNNQRSNIRLATRAQNQMNKKKKPACSSIYKGVYFRKCRRKWISYIRINKQKTFVGYFDTEVEAALAWNEAAKKNHGKFAVLNEL